MGELTKEQLEYLIDQNFDNFADEVFDQQLTQQIQAAGDPSDFKVTTPRLEAAAAEAFAMAPMNLRMAGLAALSSKNNSFAALASDGGASLNPDPIVNEADSGTREAAADGVRDYICNVISDELKEKINDVKEWIEKNGLKDAIKKLGKLAKRLTLAAVTAVAGVVGSTFLAYLLIGVAVAAVGAAIYFLVKHGLPNYCPASA